MIKGQNVGVARAKLVWQRPHLPYGILHPWWQAHTEFGMEWARLEGGSIHFSRGPFTPAKDLPCNERAHHTAKGHYYPLAGPSRRLGNPIKNHQTALRTAKEALEGLLDRILPTFFFVWGPWAPFRPRASSRMGKARARVPSPCVHSWAAVALRAMQDEVSRAVQALFGYIDELKWIVKLRKKCCH